MSRYWDTPRDEPLVWPMIRDAGICIVSIVAAGMAGYPQYNVWQQGLVGKAALERAMQDRQIKVQEAQAKMDSAVMLAKAEVMRADGVAKANAIIGDSLRNNEAYLRYLWIHNLESGGNQVIYVPTEAGLPILEAGKRPTMAASGAK